MWWKILPVFLRKTSQAPAARLSCLVMGQQFGGVVFLSVLEIFKIGVGPSSSHTMGPMIAANRFARGHLDDPAPGTSVEVVLWGSLAFTGKGHATDRAVILGLAGIAPETLEPGHAVMQHVRLGLRVQFYQFRHGQGQHDRDHDAQKAT